MRGGSALQTGEHMGLGSVLQTGGSIEYLGYVGGLYYGHATGGGRGGCVTDMAIGGHVRRVGLAPVEVSRCD